MKEKMSHIKTVCAKGFLLSLNLTDVAECDSSFFQRLEGVQLLGSSR
jgi:hypothetical protein